jgi:hypothetical protein
MERRIDFKTGTVEYKRSQHCTLSISDAYDINILMSVPKLKHVPDSLQDTSALSK